MLESLFGCESVAKILLFIFVNQQCYGSQISRLLKISLTPVQNALQRLERGDIVRSFYQGKTKVYHFNPTYPFIREVEALLKKAYTVLSPQEKKMYSFSRPELSHTFRESEAIKNAHLNCLDAFWKKLSEVSNLSYIAKIRLSDGTEKIMKASGVISIQKQHNQIIFHERGSWHLENESEIDFTNTFCWSFDRKACHIMLERYLTGNSTPILVLFFEPKGKSQLETKNSYYCNEDTYLNSITFTKSKIDMNWRIIGPNKNEYLEFRYF